MAADTQATMKNNLSSFIAKLKQDKSLASIDEATTKLTVLLRMLSILGWDIFNSDEVKPEYVVGSQRVDYSLCNVNANKVFIEVERVGEDLEKHQEQLLNYSFKEGVKLAILTNGISWRFYLPLYEGSWEQRKFYTVEIYDQQSDDIVERFIDYLSRGNVFSGKYIQNAEAVYKSKQKDYLVMKTLPKAWNKLIFEPDELLIELVADATEKLCGYKPDNSVVENFISSSISKSQAFLDTREVKEPIKQSRLANSGGHSRQSVTSFTFKNTKYDVRYWIDVLSKTSKLMYNLHRNNFDRVLQLKGSQRPYFTKNANELRSPQEVENSGIFMETNLSAKQIRELSLMVISLFGYSESDFGVEAH